MFPKSLSVVCPFFSRMLVKILPSGKTASSAHRVISKLFEAIINKDLSRNKLLKDKQYGFHSSTSTADVLIFITHKISEALDGSYITGAIALDITKAFEKLCYTNASLEESPQLSSSFSQSIRVIYFFTSLRWTCKRQSLV